MSDNDVKFTEDEQEGIKYLKHVISIPKKKDGSTVYENGDINVCSISIVALEKSDKIPYHEHRLTHSFYHGIDGKGSLISPDQSQCSVIVSLFKIY